ncbi:MAG: aminopeptidase [Treponema sp.]|jgi:predicted aminopeptidase|nr:aminopeptidase [Treponema sp.]
MKFSPCRLYTFLPAVMAAGLILAAAACFSGCYTLKQGTAMLGYLARAVPLESLLEAPPGDPAGDPAEDPAAEENRRFVERVHDIRRFAIDELGLVVTKNYTKYVAIDRDYLAAVVSASAADSFARHEWWFPVVGSVPYKGFFSAADARKERAKLEKRGLDVWVRGVDAFSTLGWFQDPLYSYMRSYPPDRLADLLIHESFHATVFLKGHAQFNEELAEFIGTEGARLYMESRYGLDSEEYRRMTDSETDNAAFLAFIRELIAELETLYAGGGSREEKLRKKDEIIRAAKTRFDDEYESRFHSDNYRGFSGLPVNNAYLELFRLYYSGGSYLRDLYNRSGQDLPAFISAAKRLKGRDDPRAELEKALDPAGAGQ